MGVGVGVEGAERTCRRPSCSSFPHRFWPSVAAKERTFSARGSWTIGKMESWKDLDGRPSMEVAETKRNKVGRPYLC